MAKISRLAGSTGHVLEVFVQDSTSTAGAGLAGLTFGSSGLTCYYKRNRGTASVAVTLADIATLGTYASGGFKAVDGANMPGLYEFHPPDAALAAGAGSVVFYLRGVTGMAPCLLEIELTAVDNQDATAYGVSRLDAAVTTRMATFALPANFASLAVDASGRVDLGKVLGTASAGAAGYVGIDWGHVNAPTTTVNLSGTTIGTVAAVADKTGYALATAPPTAAAVAAAVWTDTTAGDFAAAGSPGKVLVGQLGGAFTTASSSIYTVAALANAPTGGSAPTAAQVATAVWADLLASADFSTAGSVGKLLKDDVDATISSRNAVAPPSSGTVAAAVWDLATSGHTTSGTFGSAMNAAGSAGDPWATSLPGAYGAGTAGNIIGNRIDAAVSTRSTYAGADTSGTTTLLARLTSTRATALDNLDAAVSTRSTYAGADTAGTTTLLARLTPTRATALDNLDAAVSTRSTYAGGDTAGTTTLLARLTPTRASGLDNLDAAVSTRSAPGTAQAIDLTARPTFRDVSAVTTPTIGDCLAAAFVECAGNESIVGTAWTKKGADNATTFVATTLDSATVPTSRTR